VDLADNRRSRLSDITGVAEMKLPKNVNLWMIVAGVGIIALAILVPTIGEEVIAVPLGLFLIAAGVGLSL